MNHMQDTQASTPTATAPFLVALAHPSAQRAVEAFAEELRREPRLFGSAPPKLGAATRAQLVDAKGIRIGMMESGRIIAMVRIDPVGGTVLAVVPEWRGKGIGRRMLSEAVHRAAAFGHQRVIMHCSQRCAALVHIAQDAGARVVDCGVDGVDVIFSLERVSRIA